MNRRLRSDSYDPQRPTVLQCRFTAPLHSRSVRGDELNSRSSTQIFGKVATHPLVAKWYVQSVDVDDREDEFLSLDEALIRAATRACER